MVKKEAAKVLAFTAEMVDKVTERKITVRVGVDSKSDGSRRLLKGKNIRQPPMTAGRGYGR